MKQTSRKYKEGDIVFYKGAICHVLKNSDGESVYIAECGADVNPWDEWLVVSPDKLGLVCAVEDRVDNAGEPAAAPGELQRGDLASAGVPAAAPAELQRGNLASEIGGEA